MADVVEQPARRTALNVAIHSWAWWVLLIATVALTASAVIARATTSPVSPPTSGIARVLGGHADPGLIASEFDRAVIPTSLAGFDLPSLPSSIPLIVLGILAIAFMIVLVRLGIVLALMYVIIRSLPIVRAWLATWIDPTSALKGATTWGRVIKQNAAVQNRVFLNGDLTPWIIIYGVLVLIAMIAFWHIARGTRAREE